MRTKAKQAKSKLVLLITVLCVLILSGSAIWGSSQSAFCKNCHEMGSVYNSWSLSSHRTAACVSCHVGQGPINVIVHKIESTNQIISHVLGSYEIPINANSEVSQDIPSENCTTCHKAPSKKNYDSLVFPHKKHLKIVCAYCHNRVAHSILDNYVNRLNMDYCEECHDRKEVSTKCNTCHKTKKSNRTAAHYSDGWLINHKLPANSSCTSDCHEKPYCNDCHKDKASVPSSHKDVNWALAHRKTSHDGCTPECHNGYFCSGCHIFRNNKGN